MDEAGLAGDGLMPARRLAWRALGLVCRPALAAFRRSLQDTAMTQARLLARILAANRETVFGRQHGFGRIRNWQEFRERVPCQSPVDFQAWVQRLLAGERQLLSVGEPRFFGLTSGLGGEPKLIPHPQAGLAAFSRAIRIWLADLLHTRPGIMDGRAYLSISPPLAGTRPAMRSSIPLGMSRPARHLAFWGEWLQSRLTVAPAAFDAHPAWAERIAEWRFHTGALLLRAGDLSLVSVASPGFLEMLWQIWQNRGEEMVSLIRAGSSVPLPGYGPLPPDPRRADQLAACQRDPCAGLAGLWPKLALVSCWNQGAAAALAEDLGRRLGGIPVQGKGLWCTEAPVSIPLMDARWPVLAVDCLVCEFINDAGVVFLAHELEREGEYRLLLTTAGGLYRYELGDRVRVRGFTGTAPLLEFLGREGVRGDLAGEKLSEAQAAAALPSGVGPLMLLPAVAQGRYLLVMDRARHDGAAAALLARQTEQALLKNWLYADRRALGLLQPVAPCGATGRQRWWTGCSSPGVCGVTGASGRHWRRIQAGWQPFWQRWQGRHSGTRSVCLLAGFSWGSGSGYASASLLDGARWSALGQNSLSFSSGVRQLVTYPDIRGARKIQPLKTTMGGFSCCNANQWRPCSP